MRLLQQSLLIICLYTIPVSAQQGTIVTATLSSVVLKDNRTGLDSNRKVKVYLPPGYANSGRAYPVVYYCHSFFTNPDQLFENTHLPALLDRAFTNGVVKEFILVAADYTSPTIGSLFENSTTTGRWLDFTANELVPFIDQQFRTIRDRNSRALTGDFFGGRGALALAMTHAELFSVVYAMHPVATGMGYIPWATLPIDWKKIYQAKKFQDANAPGFTTIFLAIQQAFLPNPNRPPFYCDYFYEMDNGTLKLNVAHTQQLKSAFLLDHMLEKYADKLRSMRGIAFDWGRYDGNQDHVYGAVDFSRTLEDFGIEHEAEEYRGDPWKTNWTEYGRFYARVLPFFARYLVFEAGK
jgi:hypothetical protein